MQKQLKGSHFFLWAYISARTTKNSKVYWLDIKILNIRIKKKA